MSDHHTTVNEYRESKIIRECSRDPGIGDYAQIVGEIGGGLILNQTKRA